MAKVDLRKTVYNKDQFSRAVGGREFTTFGIQALEDIFTVEDFFNEYENLFLSIPINGATNSHEYLVRKSGELVGFQRTTEDIQPLLDEIASLRDQLLVLQQENIDLQIADAGDAQKLQDQFQATLEALAAPPPPFPDIVLPDININLDGEDEEEDISTTTTTTTVTNEPPRPVDDVISVSIAADKEISRTSINVLSNDTDPEGETLTFIGIKDLPKFGRVDILNPEDGIVQYIPNLRAPSGQKADSFTYTVTDDAGNSGVGTVFVNITNNYLLLTEAGDDALAITIGVDDKERPNETYFVQDNVINVLENDEGLDLAFDGIVTQPQYGTLTATDDGIITYIPRIGIRSTAGEIDLNAFFTPGAGVEPVVKDSFTYRVRNLNTADRTDTASVSVSINVSV